MGHAVHHVVALVARFSLHYGRRGQVAELLHPVFYVRANLLKLSHLRPLISGERRGLIKFLLLLLGWNRDVGEFVDFTFTISLDGNHLLHGVVHLDPEFMTVDATLTQRLAEVVKILDLLVDLRKLVLDDLFHFALLLASVGGRVLFVIRQFAVGAAALLAPGVVRHFGLGG